MPAAEAARVLAGRFGCSPRQARRYVDQAAARAGFRCRRPPWCSRSRCRPGSRMLSASMPACRAARSPPSWRRRWRSFWPGPQKPSPQVNDRPVETEFVFDRHAATELSVAYAILVPQRQARIARPGQEGRPPRDQRGDLRPGLQRPAEEGRDDRVADRGAARARRAEPGLRCPNSGCSKTKGIPARRWSARRWSGCGTWSRRCRVDVVLVYSPDRLARKFAYQALLIEEFARAGVRAEFVKGPRGDSPEDAAAGAVPGHDRRVREGPDRRAVPARQGPPGRAPASVNVLSGAPFGYRYVRKTEHAEAAYEIVDARGGDRRGAVPPLRRRRGLDRRSGPLADRPGRAHPHRQAPLGPLRGLGDAAQPRLCRARPASARPWPPAGRQG